MVLDLAGQSSVVLPSVHQLRTLSWLPIPDGQYTQAEEAGGAAQPRVQGDEHGGCHRRKEGRVPEAEAEQVGEAVEGLYPWGTEAEASPHVRRRPANEAPHHRRVPVEGVFRCARPEGEGIPGVEPQTATLLVEEAIHGVGEEGHPGLHEYQPSSRAQDPSRFFEKSAR